VIKRLIWLGTGFGLGVAASVRARRSTAQLAPSAVVEQLRRDLEAAVEEGRREMRAREAVLRALLARPGRGSADAGR
jgi:hypothetical protein